jgi:hypothetical protein
MGECLSAAGLCFGGLCIALLCVACHCGAILYGANLLNVSYGYLSRFYRGLPQSRQLEGE